MGIDARAAGAMRAYLVPLRAINPLGGAPQMGDSLCFIANVAGSQQVERCAFIW